MLGQHQSSLHSFPVKLMGNSSASGQGRQKCILNLVQLEERGSGSGWHATKYQHPTAVAAFETLAELSLYAPWFSLGIPKKSLTRSSGGHSARYARLDSVPAQATVAKYDVAWQEYGVEPIAEFVIAAAFQWLLGVDSLILCEPTAVRPTWTQDL